MQICLWRGFWLRGKQITAFKCLYFISIEMRAPFDHDDLKSKKKTAQRRKFNSWMRFFSGSWDDFMQTLKKFHWRMYLWSKTRLRLWVTVILPSGTLRIDALMSFSCCYLQRKKILFYVLESASGLLLQAGKKHNISNICKWINLTRNKNHTRSNLNVKSTHSSRSRWG